MPIILSLISLTFPTSPSCRRLPSSSRVHDGLASLLAKGPFKVGAIVLGKVVPCNGLSTILVDSLENLVAGCVSKTREQRDKLASRGGSGLVLEDDLLQLGGIGDLVD